VCIACDAAHAMQTPLAKPLQKTPPVHLCFGKCHADTEHRALTIDTNPGGDQDRAIDDAAPVTHLFVASVQEDLAVFTNWPVVALADLLVE